jgi:hypothetical protein
MSRKILYIAIAVIAIFSASPASAAGRTVPGWSATHWTAAEKNYIHALSCECDGVRISAAEFLGRYQMTESVTPLIEMLHKDKSEQARKAAALSLIMLNVEEGVKAVEEASLYDGSDKVTAFCQHLLSLPSPPSYTTLAE